MQDTDAQQVDTSTRNVIRVLRETHVEKKKWDDNLDIAAKAGYCVCCRRPWPCEAERLAVALEAAPTWEERVIKATDTIMTYTNVGTRTVAKQFANFALRAAFPERAPESL